MKNEQMSPEFEASIASWQRASEDAQLALDRYEAIPDVVNRLAAGMALAAMEVPLDELCGWAAIRQDARATEIYTLANKTGTELRLKMKAAGLATSFQRGAI